MLRIKLPTKLQLPNSLQNNKPTSRALSRTLMSSSTALETASIPFFPGSQIVDHFSSRISSHSPSSSSDKDLYQHLQSLNLAFRSSQVNLNSAAVIADGGVKKSHVITAAAHIWADNSVIKQLQVHSLNVTSIKVELMAIRTGLTPAMEIDSVHNITVITNSIAAAKKILESKVDPFTTC